MGELSFTQITTTETEQTKRTTKEFASGDVSAVGEELRVHILNERMQKFVVGVVDACFGQMPADEIE
jgi:hypothetical protein